MPRLAERAMILEDELADEQVEVGAEKIDHDRDHVAPRAEIAKHRIAMEPEDFRDLILGVLRQFVGAFLGGHQHVGNVCAPGHQARDLDRPREHRRAHPAVGKIADDEKAVFVPLASLLLS